MDASKDIQTIQTGGGPETVASLLGGNVDAAGLVAPGDFQVASRGYRYVVNGFDLKILCRHLRRHPALADQQARAGDQPLHARHGRGYQVHAQRRALVYKVLGKYLRITDPKVLDASYNSEIAAMEHRLEIHEAALQASLDEIAPLDARAKADQTGRHDRPALSGRIGKKRGVCKIGAMRQEAKSSMPQKATEFTIITSRSS